MQYGLGGAQEPFTTNGTAESDLWTLVQPTSPASVSIVTGEGADTVDYRGDFGGTAISRNDIITDFSRSDSLLLPEEASVEQSLSGAVVRSGSGLTIQLPGVDFTLLAIDQGNGYRVAFADAPTSIILTGTAGDDLIQGGTGNDSLFGALGNDTLRGGQGDDTLLGGQGNDEIYGGQGNDYVYAGQGDDTIQPGLGNDMVESGQGNDVILAGQGNDTILAGQGDDYVMAGQGDDWLSGGLGNDTLNGVSGNDTIDGKGGDDLLIGGEGADLFVFTAPSGTDTIADFNAAEGDRLQLAAGASYTVSDTAEGALVAFAGGGSVLLRGVLGGDVGAAILVAS